ncbi:MAG: hypothetical protein E7Z64_02325 [Thermoplasmata archaeon]|jgi:hypothetical protein|nr:hypothetical protein [Thermoplasmata archaeon]
MDLKNLYPYIVAAFLLAIILFGEVIVATNSHDDYTTSIEVDGNRIDFEIESDNAHTYDVVAIDNTFGNAEMVYIYYDPDYESAAKNGKASMGARALDEEYYVEEMFPTLKVRDVTNVKTADAEKLGEIMSQSGKGIVVVTLSGSLPDTVYSGDANDPVFDWMNSGGRLYWVGNIVGKYVSHQDSIEEVNRTDLFLGASDCVDEYFHTAHRDYEGNPFRHDLFFQGNWTTYGVIESKIPEDVDYQCMGYYDGERASITMVSHGEGMVCVVAGEYSIRQRNDLAQLIASGVGPDSVVVRHVSGSVYGTERGTIELTGTEHVDSVFIQLGGAYTVYCRNHEVE